MTPEDFKQRFPNASKACIEANSVTRESLATPGCISAGVRERTQTLPALQSPRQTGDAHPRASGNFDKASGRREVAELHKPFMHWLSMHNIIVSRARSDMRSGLEIGHADFGLQFGGLGCMIEMKWPGAKLSEDQEHFAARCRASGVPFAVCFSVEEAIAFARTFLHVTT